MSDEVETRLLAAIAYGESSTADVYEEMAAIASVMVRQMRARGYKTIASFTSAERSFSFVVADRNKRFTKFMNATHAEIEKSAGMSKALEAANNALTDGTDHSGGAYFWDGADIKTNYNNHVKVRAGIYFSAPQHNIYDVAPTDGEYQLSIRIKRKKAGKIIHEKKVIGTYPYLYESTAAHGGTIFWKLGADWLKVSRG